MLVLLRTLRSTAARGLQRRTPARRGNDLSPRHVMFGLLGANTLVLGGWWYAKDQAQHGDPRAYRFMMRHFTSGELHLREGRWWTLLTACLSHQDLAHYGVNMLTLGLTAPALMPLIGAPGVLTLYMGAGLVASATSIVWPYIVDPILHGDRTSLARRRYHFSQGASGA
ncbi:rhomboid protease [Malassezia nana]|uniref:Rhomboid protease n=1 Tax=Malassezia nana TaxID=180528 RepID=A0AAF0EJY9_9BASI|nr:rhomboid protease [Malassezia nana]